MQGKINKKLKRKPNSTGYPFNYSPYSTESKLLLSENICLSTIKIRKKIVRKTKRAFSYLQLFLTISSAVTPSQSIGIVIPINRSVQSNRLNIDLKEQQIKITTISEATVQLGTKPNFSKTELNELYEIAKNIVISSSSKDELLAKVNQLRAGWGDTYTTLEKVACLVIMLGVMFALSADAAYFNGLPRFSPAPGSNSQTYGNFHSPYQGGIEKHTGPKSVTVVGATRSGGSEKYQNDPSQYDHISLMEILQRQNNRKTIKITVAGDPYNFANPIHFTSNVTDKEIEDVLADLMYDSIRNCTSDVNEIAENMDWNPYYVQKIKDHVFYNKHVRYDPSENNDSVSEPKRFDADFHQAIAWKRLASGQHQPEDIVWAKHELLEFFYEKKFNLDYQEAHKHAQQHFNGFPWNLVRVNEPINLTQQTSQQVPLNKPINLTQPTNRNQD